jgi:hypothetical protein
MNYRTLCAMSVVVLAGGLFGCGGADSALSPLAPSSTTQPTTIPPAVPGSWLSGYTLTGVSLSGVVYELTSTGRVPIAGAVVYCELCGQETHSFATADANGFYHFPGDLTTGGGVWLAVGAITTLNVAYNNEYQDPPGMPPQRQGPGWRDVLIDGDTQFDIELVRRGMANP